MPAAPVVAVLEEQSLLPQLLLALLPTVAAIPPPPILRKPRSLCTSFHLTAKAKGFIFFLYPLSAFYMQILDWVLVI